MVWRKKLQQSIRTVDDLSRVVFLDEGERNEIASILKRFPMQVTPYYLSLIDFNDEDDPLKKIAIPCLSELDCDGSYDTSGEVRNTVVRGLQHKYAETALMLTTTSCALYCRHCFRKRLVGLRDYDSAIDFDAIYGYLMAHPEIVNVLVSGGDALMNTNERLDSILALLAKIPHLQFIRIATRIPVSMPSRIIEDEELLAILAKYNARKKIYLITQFDHPREITARAAASIEAVLGLGIPIRNQAVLLRGVNDRGEVLSELLGGLVSIGVEPYYVFQCRPVVGVKNIFQVPLQEGLEIVEKAKATQSGLGKSFRFCMSHVTGKIEVLGSLEEGVMLFKYHEAKDRSNLGRVFAGEIAPDQAWLPEEIR